MITLVVAIFCIVYVGMILGGLPFVALDRTGVALLGATAMLTLGDMSLERAAAAIHLPTILLLFAFMVISAQLRLGGFYARVTVRLAAWRLSPAMLLGLLITWAFIAWHSRGRWLAARTVPQPMATTPARDEVEGYDHWQTAKGLVVATAICACFLFTSWPREVVALTGAGILMLSRKLHSRDMLGLVDWGLLVLFMGLFVVNAAFEATGIPAHAMAALAQSGIDVARPTLLFPVTFVLSNIVSNVPAIMLLLPIATQGPVGPLLALASTLAGNLLLVGSVANLIVADAALRHGVALDWRRHMRVGVPVTLLTCAVAAVYLALRWNGPG